jgi:16S rRNA (adenine1518-N6/adenine1519-N6)-dimethyltransferase
MTEKFYFKKKYGQNFINDANITRKIASLSDVTKDDLIIEIGPGQGALTKELLKKTQKVICFEIDETLRQHLEQLPAKIIYKDFLEANVDDEIKELQYDNIYIIANLPYYITTPIIEKIIASSINVKEMYLMMQKEVGERIKASTKTKEYGSLTVYINYYFEVNKVMDISRNVFFPRPNVDSVVMKFKTKKNKVFLKNETLFFELVRNSFRQKRKTIKNNLQNYDLGKIESVLIKNGMTLQTRAEEISLNIFAEIANALS